MYIPLVFFQYTYSSRLIPVITGNLSSKASIIRRYVHILAQIPATVNVLKFQTLLFLFSNKMLVIRAGTHKFLVRIANREHPDQTASSEAV